MKFLIMGLLAINIFSSELSSTTATTESAPGCFFTTLAEKLKGVASGDQEAKAKEYLSMLDKKYLNEMLTAVNETADATKALTDGITGVSQAGINAILKKAGIAQSESTTESTSSKESTSSASNISDNLFATIINSSEAFCNKNAEGKLYLIWDFVCQGGNRQSDSPLINCPKTFPTTGTFEEKLKIIFPQNTYPDLVSSCKREFLNASLNGRANEGSETGIDEFILNAAIKGINDAIKKAINQSNTGNEQTATATTEVK